MMKDDISLEYTIYFTAKKDDICIGFIGASDISGMADITNVAVLPQYRRSGVGRALVMRMIEELTRRGAVEIFLEVRKSSEPAIALYRMCGFECISTRRSYYKDPVEDALVMRREIKGY